MAVDMFLKIENAPGEAQDKAHTNEIDVLSWTFGMSNNGSTHSGGGGGSGKVDVHDLKVTKYVDSASPALTLACCNGEHFDTATLTVRKAGKPPVEYIKITMSTVMITGVSTGGQGSQDERLTESIHLNFAKVQMDYTPQKKDGSADTVKTMSWDIAKSTNE